jgi:hypothetical protein
MGHNHSRRDYRVVRPAAGVPEGKGVCPSGILVVPSDAGRDAVNADIDGHEPEQVESVASPLTLAGAR